MDIIDAGIWLFIILWCIAGLRFAWSVWQRIPLNPSWFEFILGLLTMLLAIVFWPFFIGQDRHNNNVKL